MSYEQVLIHGDLASSHILYDRMQHSITGVIDFGTAGIGDPASDFGLIITMFGESFRRRMAKFYPEIANAADRARFRAGALELEWALAGLRSNDVSWLLCHIGRARDVMPIGNRWA
jgi:aminoglycoside phosphotransferase (APT) family kinase protein